MAIPVITEKAVKKVLREECSERNNSPDAVIVQERPSVELGNKRRKSERVARLAQVRHGQHQIHRLKHIARFKRAFLVVELQFVELDPAADSEVSRRC